MTDAPLPPGWRPGGAADTENRGVERQLDKVSAPQSQLHLRPYQVEVVTKIEAQPGQIILVAPTGSGKTAIAAALIAAAEARGEPSLFLAHRRQLDSEGRLSTREDGTRSYWPLISFASGEARSRWQRAILAALQGAGVVP